MFGACREACDLASWPTRERIEALKRIVPRKKVKEVFQQLGVAEKKCPRLPSWFVVALGLFCRDSDRQVFRWLGPYRPKGTPPRSSLCEARHRLGVAPLQLLYEAVVELLGKLATPGAFYQG